MVWQWQWDFLIFVDQEVPQNIATRDILVTFRTIKYGLYIGDFWINDHFLKGDNDSGAMERNGPIPRRHLRAYLENYPMGATYSRVLPACKTKTVTLKSGEGHPRVRTTISLTFLRTWNFPNKKLKRKRMKKSSLGIKNDSSPNSHFPILPLQREERRKLAGFQTRTFVRSTGAASWGSALPSSWRWEATGVTVYFPPHSGAVISNREKDSVSIWPLSTGSAESGAKGRLPRLLWLLLSSTQLFRPLCGPVAEVESCTLEGWRAVICSSPFRVGSESVLW